MASVTRDMVITRVKSLIDELTAFTDSTLQAGSTLSTLDVVNKYIDACLNEATDAAMLVCNPARMTRTTFAGTASNTALGTSGIVYQTLSVPTDFLRIIFVKMTKWEKGVTTLISTDSETYRQMRNPHTTAGPAKPCAAMSHQNKWLELYGSREQDTLHVSSYVQRIAFSTTLTTIDDLVLSAICWRCAGEVLAIMSRVNEFKAAQGFYEEAVKLTFIA